MKSVIIFFLLSFININSYCQQRYLPGYLLSANGDTVNVALQEEIRNDLLLQVKYKKDEQSTEISIRKPGEIIGFGYTGGNVYKSISVPDGTSDSNNNIKCYFVQQLLAGSFDLYLYSKKDRQVYLVNKENHYYQLTNTIYLANGQVDEPGNYQNQLL